MRDLYLSNVPHTLTLTLGNFTVRVIQTSERYGAEGCLTAAAPMVEFYDRRYAHTPLGQFTGARYYLSTLVDGTRGGLMLAGHVPEWTVSAADMDTVRHWLQRLPFAVTV